ncbi:MAG: hypothetical protein AUI15_41370 [Actinobacteria bacterium 13_2_20CM_2_66_6]|nr:MAG: hypothetical protein AUI15_41370 [Actinobacteria bacterium 13_2_20CM_2_66_6]
MREVGQVLRRMGRPAPPSDPGALAERSDLFNALRKLPAKQAAAIVLRHHHGGMGTLAEDSVPTD